jgi:hypothetical protein
MSPPGSQPAVAFPHLLKLDDSAMHMLECFFTFLTDKMRIFNRPLLEGQSEQVLLSTNKLYQTLAKVPVPNLQDAIQKLCLLIGERALSKKNDARMKNLFFSVFIFCIKYTSK